MTILDRLLLIFLILFFSPLLNVNGYLSDVNREVVSSATMKTNADSKLTNLPTPTRSGYTFNGWFTAASGGTQITVSTAFTKDTTVFAQWTVNYVPPVYPSSPTPSNPDNSTNTNSGSSSTQPESEPAPTPVPESNNVPVIVDGKEYNIGTVEEKSNTATITVQQTELQKQIDNAKDSVIIPVSTKAGVITAQLVVKNVEDIADKGMTLTVKVGNISYNIPADAIDTKAIMSSLGITDSAKAPISITITTTVDKKTGERVAAAVATMGGEIVVPAIEFTVTATANGKKHNVDTFDKYVERAIEITAAQAKRITTAVVVEANGNMRHVPTNVYKNGNKWYAGINSRTNSTYVLIYNEKKFTDVQSKWYESSVSEMASRKIINGVSDTKFAGEQSITRAEFCAIVIRALGFPENGNVSIFKDVAKSSWYYGAVGTAYKYGIVNGKSETTFDPNANITWQEAMVMVQRAANVADYKGSIGSITHFTDNTELSDWAEEAAKFCVGSSLLASNNNGKLNPLADITRAETTDVVLKLLRKAQLIDIR